MPDWACLAVYSSFCMSIFVDKIIINDRVSLTDFYPEDKPNLLRYLNDPELHRNTLTVPNPYTEADADKWLGYVKETKAKHGMQVNWAIRHNTLGVIGGAGAFMHSGTDGHKDEIGYWLASDFRGKGVMTEIVGLYTDFLFAIRPLVRIEAWVFAHNPASARVLEKNGFEKEGYARKFARKNGEFYDAMLYAKTRDIN